MRDYVEDEKGRIARVDFDFIRENKEQGKREGRNTGKQKNKRKK